MTALTQKRLSDSSRARLFTLAGWLIIVLGAGAALLPLLDRVSGSRVVGGLLFAGGLVELFAGMLRRETKIPSMVAGAVTTFAGLMFLVHPAGKFVPTVTIVTFWLLIRSIVLFVASRLVGGSVRLWITLSAATDLVLGVVLLLGISIATLVVTLFGPTQGLIASFAWVLALSFVATGMLMLEIASCEREAAN